MAIKVDHENQLLILKATNIVIDLIGYGYDVRFNSSLRHHNGKIRGEAFACSIISGNFRFEYGIGGLNPDENNFIELFVELERLKQLSISGVFNPKGVTYEAK